MNDITRKIVGIIAAITMFVSVFLPAISIGFISVSLWDGIEGNANGKAIVILLFSLLGILSAITGKSKYLQACSVGVFAVTLSLTIDFVRSNSVEFIGIGIILLILSSLVGIGLKEIQFKKSVIKP